MKKKNKQLVDLKAKISKTKNIFETGKMPDKNVLIKLLNEINSLSIEPVLQSETLFRTTLYSIGDAVITTDKKGNIQQMNPVAEKLCGWKEADAKNKPFNVVFNIINAITRIKVENFVNKVLKGKHIVVMANHTLLISKHGKEIPIADSSAPIKNDKGEIVGVVFVFRDQTKEQENQNALEERERTFSTLVSNLPGFVYRCANDRNWTMEFISDGCKQITGYSPKDFIDNKKLAFNDIILPAYQEAIWNKWQNVLKHKTYFEDEYPLKNKNGKICWIWERGRGVFSEQGELLFLEGFITDITKRRDVEDSLRLKNIVFESSIAANSIANLDGKIIQANNAFLILWGYKKMDEVFGKPLSFFIADKKVSALILNTLNKDGLWEGDFTARRKNRSEFIAHGLASRVHDENGNVIGYQSSVLDITSRRKADELIRESETRYKSLFNNSPDAIFLADPKTGIILDANSAALKLMGKPYSKIVGMHQSQLHPKRLKPYSIATFKKQIKEIDLNIPIENFLVTASGDEIPVEVLASPITINGKDVVQGVFRNITERRRIEAALSGSQEMLKNVIEQFPGVVFWKDYNSVYLGCNKAFANAAGLNNPTEIIGKTDFDFPWAKTEAKSYRADDREVMDKNLVKLNIIETQHQAKDKITWFDTSKVPLKDKDGNVIGVLGISNDITERVETEEALRESEAKFRSITEQTSDVVFITDSEGIITYLSPVSKNLFGFEVSELIGLNITGLLAPEYIQTALNAFLGAIEQGINTKYLELLIKRKDGSVFFGELNASQFKSGNFFGTSGTIRDISERKAIESELQKSKDRMHLLVEGTPQLFFYVQNLEGFVEYISPSIENITGHPVEQWLNQKHWFVTDSAINQTAKNRTHSHLMGEVNTDPVYVEILHANGSKVLLEIYERPIFNEGKVVGVQGVAHNITERVRFEKNLRDSETSYRGLFNSVSEAIYILDVNGIFLDVNDGAVKMYGYERDELVGKTPEFVSAPNKNNLPAVVEALIKAYNGEKQQFEFWGRRKNGEAFLKDVRLYPGKYFNQKVTIAVANDITEKKRSELLLQESEEKYRTLAENINDVLYSIARKGTLTYISSAVKHILGYEPDEVNGKLFTDYVYKEDLRQLPNQIHKILSGTTEPLEYRLLEKSGKVHWVRSSAKAVYENSKVIGFQGVMIDINNEKIIEEKLKESEERYRAISNLTSDYLFATEADKNGEHKVVWIAGSFEKITGYTIEEYKKIGGWRALLHPDELEPDDLDLEKLRKNQKVIREVKTYSKNGSLVWVKSHAHPIWDNKANKLVGVYGAVEDITERRHAEETLRESEQRYHSFINSHIDLMFVKDENLKYIVANEATLKFFNKTREELLDKTDFELMDEESAKNCRLSDLKAFENNSVVITEEFTANKIFESTKFPLNLKNNKIGLGGIIRDITERKRTEIIQKIQYNIADAAVTYKTLTELFEIIRIELSSIINVNNFFIALYNEKTGMLKSDVDKDEAEHISEWPAKNSMTGYVIEKQKSVLLKKDEINRMIASGEAGMVGVIPEVWLGVPFKIGGKVFGVLVVQSYSNPNAYNQTSVEILEIVAHELSIYIKHKKAEEETLKLSTAIVQSPVIVIITDPDGNIEFANPKFSEVTGYSIEEAKGNSCRILKSGFHQTEFYTNLWKTILSGKLWQGEFRNKKKSGELYWENALISPLKDTEGNITHFVAVKEDVTSKKIMIQELIEAKEKAEEMNRIKSSFFANMSHELRTPMVGILGFSEVLMSELKNNPDYLHMISSINKSGQRLLETLNLILSLSKLEASKIEANLKSQNIVPILKESFNFFQSAAANKGLSYTFITEKDELLCEIDQLLFISVFNNLLNNAIKFTDAGSIVLSVTVKTGKVIISVADTGVGISDEKQSVIWDEFRQASEGFNRSFEGTGLGLTIAKRYSNLMKGTISINSTLGKGTTFLVSFPLRQGSTESVNQGISDQGYELSQSSQSDPTTRLLYIEDDEIAVKYVSTITRGLYIVDSAKDSNEALLMVKQNKYDAILMDINLRRGMDGIELTGLIRKMESYKSIPIIAVTAFAMGREKEEFLSRGMTHYLSKPFVKNQLLHLLKEALGKD
jgi:PAS domain S-box-containing protein